MGPGHRVLQTIYLTISRLGVFGFRTRNESVDALRMVIDAVDIIDRSDLECDICRKPFDEPVSY